MISILAVVGIGLILIVVVLLITYLLGSWDSSLVVSESPGSMEALYKIPSAWSGGRPVSNSECQAYTFISQNGNVPQPSLNVLNSGILSGVSTNQHNASCVDSDQIFAQKNYHVCNYGELQDIPLAQYSGCPKIDGGNTQINGYYEEYFTACGNAADTRGTGAGSSSSVTGGNSTRCFGSVGLIAYGFVGSLPNANCLEDPIYTLDGRSAVINPGEPLRVSSATIIPPSGSVPPSVVAGTGCSVEATQNGLPSQLFRVIRHKYDPLTGFIRDYTGNWVSIVHRPTNKCIAPHTLGNGSTTPTVSSFRPDEPPILIECDSFGGKGNWFFMSPELSTPASLIRGTRPGPDPGLPENDPNDPLWDGLYWADERKSAKPQLIWAPDPSAFGELEEPDDLWNYFTDPSNNIHSLVPFKVLPGDILDYSQPTMEPYITFSPGAPSNLEALIPPSDPTSQFYTSLSDCKANYAVANASNPDSYCFGYIPANFGFDDIVGVTLPINILRPLTTTHPCYKEYVLYRQYIYELIRSSANERVKAEAGGFQYIDLALLPVILGNSTPFYDPGKIF